jgi:hypothetical protein
VSTRNHLRIRRSLIDSQQDYAGRRKKPLEDLMRLEGHQGANPLFPVNVVDQISGDQPDYSNRAATTRPP